MDQLKEMTPNLNLQQANVRPVNLLQERCVLPVEPASTPEPNLSPSLRKLNCSSDIFRCTLMNIPQTQALLKQVMLPLGLIFHPFKNFSEPLPVIPGAPPCCSMCQTYINPFVIFIDQRHWKCNTCFSLNDVPGNFLYDPITGSYCNPLMRPELQHAVLEFVATSNHQARPPQPATYLFMFDVSYRAVETGYLQIVCQILLDNIDRLLEDSETRIGFITFDSTVNFYNLHRSLSRPRMMVMSEIDDVFVPNEEKLLVNLHQSRELLVSLLEELPDMFRETQQAQCALGPALQAAQKLLAYSGGRVSVFLTQLPNIGCGSLQPRESPGGSNLGSEQLGPAIDFYKVLALEFCGQQTCVDLFLLSEQYADLASIACISRYTCGCVYYYPGLHHIHTYFLVEKFQEEFQYYLTRSVGFEALLRIRYTQGLLLHTFYGNSFLQTTELLCLPTICPHTEFAVQMLIDGSLSESTFVVFQLSLIYTSSQGERRVRIHTYCLPVVSSPSEVYAGVDVLATVGILSKKAVDRAVRSCLAYAREELMQAVTDALTAYQNSASSPHHFGLIVPYSLQQLPLYVLALLKQSAFQTDVALSLDERVFTMYQLMTQPLTFVMRMVYPDLFRIDTFTSDKTSMESEDKTVKRPALIQLSVDNLTLQGAFLMDCGNVLYIWVGKHCSTSFLNKVLGVSSYTSLSPTLTLLPKFQNPTSKLVQTLITSMRNGRLFHAPCYVIKDDSTTRNTFVQHMVEDRNESTMSYYDFLLHLKEQVCK
ncbi:protein transport protein Sec24B-like [Callorhinchus milii]|uniref:protein transport protein Sec24B-like n=1 Tax=Callorhinchus milii TaxID=7868 RepID=UPI001C3FC4F5|nr:protein transport protein Sec24B-like [Callorhinchus milii]